MRYSRYLVICGGNPLKIHVTQAVLSMIDPPAVSDEALQEHHQQASLGFSVVKDLTVDQYRKLLGQKLDRAHSFRILRAERQQVTHTNTSNAGRVSLSAAARVPRANSDINVAREADNIQQGTEEAKWGTRQGITPIIEGSESEHEGNFGNPRSRSRNRLIGKRSLPRRLLSRFSSLARVLVKKEDKK